MKGPLPKALFTFAWKAIVGYSLDKYCTQREVNQVGIRSHLFSSSTKCFYGQFFLMWFSRCKHRVPMGSLASSMQTRTSEESRTL